MSANRYRVTFDASHKVKGGGHVAGFLHHVVRDLDDANDVGRNHANVNIDRSRTQFNQTVIPDGRGGWVRPRSVDEVRQRLDDRLGTVKKPLRTDAVVMRPIVCNLSPEWFAEHCPDWKTDGLNEAAQDAYDALLEQAVKEFGADNIVCASLHMDESLPQWQIAVTPVTDDGRLSQKDWYPGPKQLQAMGKRFRQAVASTGIDVEMNPSARSKEHLDSDGFQKLADRRRGDAEAAARAKAEAEATRAATAAEFDRVRRADEVVKENAVKVARRKDAVEQIEAQATAAEAAARRRLTEAEEYLKDAEKKDEAARRRFREAGSVMSEAAELAAKLAEADPAKAYAAGVADALRSTVEILSPSEAEMTLVKNATQRRRKARSDQFVPPSQRVIDDVENRVRRGSGFER